MIKHWQFNAHCETAKIIHQFNWHKLDSMTMIFKESHSDFYFLWDSETPSYRQFKGKGRGYKLKELQQKRVYCERFCRIEQQNHSLAQKASQCTCNLIVESSLKKAASYVASSWYPWMLILMFCLFQDFLKLFLKTASIIIH